MKSTGCKLPAPSAFDEACLERDKVFNHKWDPKDKKEMMKDKRSLRKVR